MEVIETKVTLRKLVPNEGKVLRTKQVEYDEQGNEIPRSLIEEVYLSVNDSVDNYEEVERN